VFHPELSSAITEQEEKIVYENVQKEKLFRNDDVIVRWMYAHAW
jgi:hypothetical protein